MITEQNLRQGRVKVKKNSEKNTNCPTKTIIKSTRKKSSSGSPDYQNDNSRIKKLQIDYLLS